MKIRVFYKQDKSIITLHLVRKLKEGETIEQALDLETIKSNISYPYEDLEPTAFPDKTKRSKWRGEKGKGIWIDESIVTPEEKRKAKELELDEELANPNADPVKVIRLNRELEKMK